MNSRAISLTSKKRDSRGRNGYFRANTLHVCNPGNAHVVLDVWSRRTDGRPPIVLTLGIFDALELADTLIDMARNETLKRGRDSS